MSSAHVIDNDDPLLFFDPLESGSDFGFPSSSTSMEARKSSTEAGKGKGKTTSSPVPIMVPSEPGSSTLDDFSLSLSPSWSISSSFREPPGTPIVTSSSPTPSSPTFTLGSFTSAWQNSTPDSDQSLLAGSSLGGKGKERASVVEDEPPITIPPLTFSPIATKFDQVPTSSGISLSYPLPAYIQGSESNVANASPTQTTITNASPVQQHLLRRHSVTHSRSRSITATTSIHKFKLKLGSSTKIHSSTLTRKLLNKKVESTSHFSADPFSISVPNSLDVGTPEFVPNNETFLSEAAAYHGQLRNKGRSHSSSYPPSILDIISPTSPDLFLPIALPLPLKTRRNCFDEKLPRELKLKVFACLVELCETEHRSAIDKGNWTALKAASSKNRWVGKDRAIRQLVKLSQVSKGWQALVFDGQLWATIDLRSFPTLPKSLLSRIANAGGQFATVLDLSGHSHLNASTLLDITDKLTITPDLDSASATNAFTRLTTINLRGCCSVSTRSLHHLLVRSPLLERLCINGLTVVTNTTCDILAMYCHRLVSLDVSRCSHVDAEGIRRMLCAHEWPNLTELNLGGLKNVSDKMMSTLAKAVPNLEVLDLTDARQVHNTAIEAFVQPLGDQPSMEYLADGVRTLKRVTKLRRLSVSGCILLTDIACLHLAGAVPELELFEMGGIGEDLKEDGLIKLLETTPMIRRLDLEDACELTDALLAVLTPGVEDPVLQEDEGDGDDSNGSRVREPEPGHIMEHLILSYATRLTDDALINLIRRCRRLAALELDNTRIGSNVVKEFVEASRKRGIKNAMIVAVDCRLVGEAIVRELIPETRPRVGWRSWEARKLKFFDARDFATRSTDVDDTDAEVKQREKDKEKEAIVKTANGQDELDEKRVVLKTFYSWQNVDAVWAAREKRNKRRKANSSNDSELTDSEADLAGSSSRRGGSGRGSMRWWSPGGRRSRSGSGTNSPNHLEMNGNDGCTIM
ncbi:RNI-like protein [Marasmius fiardii PR-910]|nr:RNI-like protein [Marasmius fiardii PR-910]